MGLNKDLFLNQTQLYSYSCILVKFHCIYTQLLIIIVRTGRTNPVALDRLESSVQHCCAELAGGTCALLQQLNSVREKPLTIENVEPLLQGGHHYLLVLCTSKVQAWKYVCSFSFLMKWTQWKKCTCLFASMPAVQVSGTNTHVRTC